MLDVLGFGRRVLSTDLSALVQGYRQFIRSAFNSAKVPVFSLAGTTTYEVGVWVFSDTVMLWCNDDLESLDSLLSTTGWLVSQALQLGWPIRGGIAGGDCVIDPANGIMVGNAIVDAYDTEKNQDWVGVGLHESVASDSRLNGPIERRYDTVVSYPVPTKRLTPAVTHAVNWGPYGVGCVSALAKIAATANDPEVSRKMNNADQFLHATCDPDAAALS